MDSKIFIKIGLVILFTFSFSFLTFSQTPEMFKYQAVLRDASGNVLANQSKTVVIDILKTSPSGTSVFTESHSVTTNTQGVINLNIGSVNTTGIAVIDWSVNSYFIKITVEGVEMGTSQLLSVPYALYAKSSGTSGGGHYIGELYGGGVVFWVNHTGQHGLIASMIDLSTAQVWSNLSTTIIGENAQSDWNGNANTNAIIGQIGHTSSAAKLCADYTNADYGTGTFSDWYLPSRDELNDLWNNLKAVQKALDSDENGSTTTIVKQYYWSSTEFNSSIAWYFYFGYGSTACYYKDSPYYIRAVRAF